MIHMSTTSLDRETALELHGGYTELSGERYVLVDAPEKGSLYQFTRSILTAYEYGSNNEETGYKKGLALECLLNLFQNRLAIETTFGGYRFPSGDKIEENGLLLSLPYLSDVELGVFGLKIAQMFRQESVLVFDGDGVGHFVKP